MKNTIWITGAAGKLGKELTRYLKQNTENKVIATDQDVDITDRTAVSKAIDIYHPMVVINCASISDVAYCEENPVEAYRVNALGARNLASVTRRQNVKLIQMSTDDVFDGNHSEQLNEFDTPIPVTVYGKSKLAGENFVRELNPKHLIIRSSWVYGSVAKTPDFYHEVLELGRQGKHFPVALDRMSTPTSVQRLADVVTVLMEQDEYGTYHASCGGCCSRHAFAQEILRLHGMDASLAEPVCSEQGAVSTVLENLMLNMTGLYEMPDWQEELSDMIEGEEK